MDYVGSEDYRVTYGHDDRFFTYKMDFVPAILARGVMKLQVEKCWVTEPYGADRLIGVDELDPFLKNTLIYLTRRGCISCKDFDVSYVNMPANGSRFIHRKWTINDGETRNYSEVYSGVRGCI